MEEIREIRASESRGKPMYMRDWSDKLDAFLKFDERIFYRTQARYRMKWRVAEKEYENFRVEQDKRFESDFDRLVKKYLSENAKNRQS